MSWAWWRGLHSGIVSACHRGDWSYGSWDRISPGYWVEASRKNCSELCLGNYNSFWLKMPDAFYIIFSSRCDIGILYHRKACYFCSLFPYPCNWRNIDLYEFFYICKNDFDIWNCPHMYTIPAANWFIISVYFLQRSVFNKIDLRSRKQWHFLLLRNGIKMSIVNHRNLNY
jgi:hypothetical protein